MLTTQVNLIKDKDIKRDVEYMLTQIPEYFYTVPASSTGKYHPEFSLGEGGLVRHTKAAVRIAVELFELEDFNDKTKDMIIAALILHDSLKHGYSYSEYTQFEHPIYAAQFLIKNFEEGKLNSNENIIHIIAELIACHMGKWNTNKYSMTELPLPSHKVEKFVHMCDYLASRKFLNIKFTDNEIDEE